MLSNWMKKIFFTGKIQVQAVLRGHGLGRFIDEDGEIPPKFIKFSEDSSHSIPNPEHEA